VDLEVDDVVDDAFNLGVQFLAEITRSDLKLLVS
jgi:hypothetical protein